MYIAATAAAITTVCTSTTFLFNLINFLQLLQFRLGFPNDLPMETIEDCCWIIININFICVAEYELSCPESSSVLYLLIKLDKIIWYFVRKDHNGIVN